jgi:hypothetical protein
MRGVDSAGVRETAQVRALLAETAPQLLESNPDSSCLHFSDNVRCLPPDYGSQVNGRLATPVGAVLHILASFRLRTTSEQAQPTPVQLLGVWPGSAVVS